MSVGESAAHANAVLNLMRNTTVTGFTPYLKLHTGDPGAAGTANASSRADRLAVTFAAPANGAMTAPAVSWTAWASGSQTITHVSFWDAATGGAFRKSAQLAAPKSVENDDTLNIAVSATQGPIAT